MLDIYVKNEERLDSLTFLLVLLVFEIIFGPKRR